MKTLHQFIFERVLLQKLPFDFELFKNFINDVVLDGEYDDSPYWEQMKDAINNDKIFDWFHSWCESYIYLKYKKNVTLEAFFNMLTTIPMNRIERVIGAGSSGVILSVGTDSVIKIYYEDSTPKEYDALYKHLLKEKDTKTLPKIYRTGKNWVVLERLNTGTPKCREYMDIIDNFKQNGNGFIKGLDKIDPSKLEGIQLEVYNWCIETREHLKEINTHIKWPGDLRHPNIGERRNGDIVFFDP